MPNADTDTDLPVPVDEARTYVDVVPTDDALDPATVESHVRRLHRLRNDESTGLLARLRGDSSPSTIEYLLVSDGGDDPRIRQVFGVATDHVEVLERTLRGLYPSTYELERSTAIPATLTAGFDASDDVAAVEFHGVAERPADWQTRLTPFREFCDRDGPLPLSAVVEAMADTTCAVVFQALFQPMSDWTGPVDERCRALETHRDTLGGKLAHSMYGPPDESVTLSTSDEARIEELTERDARRSFVCNARVIAVATDDEPPALLARQLESTFEEVSHTCYAIEGSISTGKSARTVVDAVRERTMYPPRYGRLRDRLPWRRTRSRGIVVDPSEAPNFCLLGGDALGAAGARSVAPTPGERTAIPRPPVDQLSHYRGDGMVLGRPLTQDGTPDPDPLVLPPALQSLHVAWVGKTGSGKTIGGDTAVLSNHVATDGADIMIEPKGDDNTIDVLRMHYARHGSLDNVLYLDCSRVLPAFSFFDIRDELDAGVSRTTAVEDRVDHYVEILTQIMGRDRFEQAVRSPDVIRYLVKAMFDPVSGSDAFSHRDLHTAVRRMHDRQTAPPVADGDLERMLAGVVANRARSFDEIMQGVANRMEKIPVDERLARVFNHVPDDDPHFDLADYLDEDVLIIFDTGDLRSEAQRVLTLVILSNLWTALRRRARSADGDLLLVNVYIEEAASIAVSALLKDLLSQSRSFGCSLTLAMQFPGQLRGASDDVYAEMLNNISTFVTGNVPVDRRLADRLATDDMNAEAVGNRLRSLRRGQWLVSLPAAFGQPEPRPFLLRSVAPPPGHPASDQPLSSEETEAFHVALEAVRAQTTAEAGLELEIPRGVSQDDEADDAPVRVDSALPHTTRMPPTVEYRSAAHLLACRECDDRFDPDIDGMRTAIECCSSLDDVDSDDVPVCDLNLKLSPDERAVSGYTDPQLMFLQAVYNAQQLRYDPLEYDLRWDSMIRLQEYVDVDSDAVQDLIDDGHLTKDADRPHRLYSVTPSGRSTIGERYRLGKEYGHGKGDLEETSQHVLGVVLAKEFLEREYVDDPDSEVEEVIPYFDLEERDEPAVPIALAMGDENLRDVSDEFDHRRIDVAALDSDGRVVVAVEVERINHDRRRAVPKDFDKMAECNPDEAIWIAMSHAEAHQILDALNNPLEGDPRIEKTYSESTPVQLFKLDAPGCTAMHTLEQVRDTLEDDSNEE